MRTTIVFVLLLIVSVLFAGSISLFSLSTTGVGVRNTDRVEHVQKTHDSLRALSDTLFTHISTLDPRAENILAAQTRLDKLDEELRAIESDITDLKQYPRDSSQFRKTYITIKTSLRASERTLEETIALLARK